VDGKHFENDDVTIIMGFPEFSSNTNPKSLLIFGFLNFSSVVWTGPKAVSHEFPAL